MLCFAATQPPHVPRIALVDFNNDSVGTSLAVTRAMFEQFRVLKIDGHVTEADRFRLFGVRLDTSGTVRDIAPDPLASPALDLGVNPRLVAAVRQALDRAWEGWDIPQEWQEEAKTYCRNAQIVVSGGFTPEKINRFESLDTPVDIYGIGSSLMANDASTNTDFTADVTAVCIDGQWTPMAKIGRQSCDNPDLERIPVDYVAREEMTNRT